MAAKYSPKPYRKKSKVTGEWELVIPEPREMFPKKGKEKMRHVIEYLKA